jgi:hypothetical protein
LYGIGDGGWGGGVKAIIRTASAVKKETKKIKTKKKITKGVAKLENNCNHVKLDTIKLSSETV